MITVWPSWLATKSFTLLGEAWPRWFPPIKCSPMFFLAAHEEGVPLAWAPESAERPIVVVGEGVRGVVWWGGEEERRSACF